MMPKKRMPTKYTRDDVEALNQITQAKLSLLQLKEKIGATKKGNNKYGKWTYKNCKFIADNWGKMSVIEIAEKLKRSKISINERAQRLGLKKPLLYSNYITVCELITAINGTTKNYTWMRYLMNKYNAPIVQKVMLFELEVDYIKLDDFYDWYKNHISILDLNGANLEFFKDAPDWFLEKHKADTIAHQYLIKTPWTNKDDETLKEMINAGCGYKEISIKLKRTGGAIKRRIADLKIKKHPKKAYNHISWTDAEIETVKDLYLKGYKPIVIMQYLDRSDLAINGLLERHNYFGRPPERFKPSKI